MFSRGSLGIVVIPRFINQFVSPWFPWYFCYSFLYKSMCFPVVPVAFLLLFPVQINVFPRGSLGIFVTYSCINRCVSQWSHGHLCYSFLSRPMCFPLPPWDFCHPFLYESMFFPVFPLVFHSSPWFPWHFFLPLPL